MYILALQYKKTCTSRSFYIGRLNALEPEQASTASGRVRQYQSFAHAELLFCYNMAMHTVVKASEGTIRRIADNKTANNLITKEISPGVSLATTEATDYYEKETSGYDRIYYVLDGELQISSDGKESTLQAGDACFIPKGTTYEMRGTFKALTVNQPAFGS